MSDTRYLAPLRQWVVAVQKIVGGGEFPESAVVPCSLALIEAVNNAIFHAHGCAKDLPVGVSLSLRKGRIQLEVVDSGPGVGNPELPGPDEMVTHGRGLFIIRELMSEVKSRVTGGFHHMRMIYEI